MKRFVTLVSVLFATSLLSGCIETQKGEKIGMITKVAQEGFFCPTWEAQIIRGGFNQGSGASGTAFEFTIEDAAMAEKVTKLAEERKEVKITYRKEWATICRSDSHNYFLVSIEELKHEEQGKGSVAVEIPGLNDKATASQQAIAGADKEKIVQLLKVQAQLIEELSKGVK